MKIKKCLNYILAVLILIAFCLSIAAFAKVNHLQTVSNNDTEIVDADFLCINEYFENNLSIQRFAENREIIPYMQDGERRYIVVGGSGVDFIMVVCKVENNKVILLKTAWLDSLQRWG